MTVRYSIRILLYCVAAVALLFGIARLGIDHQRSLADQIHCKNNLVLIGLGLRNYKAANDSPVPIAAASEENQSLYSWRVLVAMKNEGLPGFVQNAAWNSEKNIGLSDHMPPYFASPLWPNKSPNNSSYSLIRVGKLRSPGGSHIDLLPRDEAGNELCVVGLPISQSNWAAPENVATFPTLDQLLEKVTGMMDAHSAFYVLFSNGSIGKAKNGGVEIVIEPKSYLELK